METNFDAFNFDNMVQAVGIDPFAQTANKYAKDERFYTLTKDKAGNGAALIRFLPDANNHMIQKMFKIKTTITKNDKKRFLDLFSPVTIGQPCPFQEEWQRLWNEGKKEESKTFGRSAVYVANIKVLKDPKNPDNEGKIFLYQFSGALNAKLESAMKPSDDDIALGKLAKEIFNPGPQGHSFRLVAQKGSNGQINYDNSEIVPEKSSIYNTVEEALNDIKNNTYTLADLIKPESFLPYAELKDKFSWVTFANETVKVETPVVEVAQPAQVVPEVQPTQVVQPVQSSTPSLDDMLNGLM